MVFDHVHISRGVSKLGADIPSVSLPYFTTCRPDAPCFKLCYVRRGRFSFRHNKELLERNLRIWHESPEQFAGDVKIAAYHSRFFRWHSSGDIPDVEYLSMMVDIARDLPATKFLCFTKKFELVNEYVDTYGPLPENLIMTFSCWGDWMPDNPHGFPMAYIRFKNCSSGIPENAIQCPKYCGECVMSGCSCWDLKSGESVVFDQH